MAESRSDQRQATRLKVITTAGALFRSAGFAQTTIRDIAQASAVSVGTVMSVGDKDALLVASFDHQIRELEAQHPPAAVDHPHEGAVDRIVALFRPFVAVFAQDPTLARRYGAILVAGRHSSVVFTELAPLLVTAIAAELRDTGVRDAAAQDADAAAALAESIYFAYLGRLLSWPPDQDDHAVEVIGDLRRMVAAISGNGKSHP